MRPCAVEGCPRPHFAKGWCNTHYYRLRRNGTLDLKSVVRAAPKAKAPRPEKRECAAPGCNAIEDGRCGMCKLHDTRRRRHGDPTVMVHQRDRNLPRGDRNANWTGDAATYSAVHQRVKKVRGAASEHRCKCDATARQWAYQHGDPNERIGPMHNGELAPYSTNIQAYEPMCVPCHKKYDLGVIRANQKEDRVQR